MGRAVSARRVGDGSTHLDGFPVTASTYSNKGCRCDGCRTAIMTYRRLRSVLGYAPRLYESRSNRIRIEQAIARHGTASAAARALGIPYVYVRSVFEAMEAS
jgi:hypothetical protein